MDARYKATEDAILKGMIKLLKKQPIFLITISDLSNEAGIDKATFYRHYSDIGDWKLKTEAYYLDMMNECFNNAQDKNWKPLLEAYLKKVKEEKELTNLLYSDNFRSFVCIEIAHSFLRAMDHKYDESVYFDENGHLTKDYMFIVSGIGILIVAWINYGMKESISSLVACIEEKLRINKFID